MSETTRTRAEIQAEIRDALNWAHREGKACAAFEMNPNEHSREHYNDVADFASIKAQDLIKAAADLIPREEHEAAVAEAVDKALNGDLSLGAMNTRVLNKHDALDVLVKEYAYKPLDNRPTELEWAHDGQLYRVTVERVDHIVDANKMIKPADAHPVHPGRGHDYQGNVPNEPASDDQASANNLVEWYAANNREHKMTWSHDVNGRTYFVCVAPHDGTGYAPDPQAVAPVGVVEEIRELGAKYIPSNDDYHRFRTALSRITELPEPLKDVKVEYHGTDVHVYEISRGRIDFWFSCHRGSFPKLVSALIPTASRLTPDCAALLAKEGE